MDQILYVLAIMGCGDDGAACQQARIEPARYASIAACQAAMPDALTRSTDVDYPVIQAACQRQGKQAAARQPGDAARNNG